MRHYKMADIDAPMMIVADKKSGFFDGLDYYTAI